mgnify:CR=1 FL=1
MSVLNRIALVNVRVESRQRIPIGPLSLAACVKDISRTIIFDPDPDQADFDDLVQFQPDLVGIGFMTQTRHRAKQIYDALRPRLPGAKFVLGGVGPTVERELTFEMFQPDALVLGEGEKALERMARGEPFDSIPGVYLPGRPFTPAEIYQDLDQIPLPPYECMPDFRKYLCPPGGIRGRWFNSGTPMIMTGRGCPFNCTFCCSKAMFPKKIRRRSVASVIREIRRLHDEFRVDSVYFFDDTFTAPPSWALEFCETLLKEPYRMTWGCQVRADLFNAEIARALKKAGCVQVDIGVESGSPKVLKALKKGERLEQIESTFRLCHEAGLAPMATFLVGCPEEAREDVAMTKALLRKIRPSFSEFFFLIPYPGTELFTQAVQHGWLKDRSYEGRGMVDRPVMEIHFSMDEQRQIRREYFRLVSWWNLKGYFAPRVLWAVVRSVRVSMVKAFFRELFRKRNLRDAMQAYVHALRAHYARLNAAG